MLLVLSAFALLTAAETPAAAGRNPAVRVAVRTGKDPDQGVRDAIRDLEEALRKRKPDGIIELADAAHPAEVDVVITLRHMISSGTPQNPRTHIVIMGALATGGSAVRVRAEDTTPAGAATRLADAVAAAVDARQLGLLARRPDWPAVGLEAELLSDERRKELGLKEGRVAVVAARPGTPAAAAGLAAGDLVVKVDGQKLESLGLLARAVYRAPSGTAVPLEVRRDGQARSVTLTVP